MPPTRISPAVTAALFWFFYLGGIGGIFPFQSLYFRENLALAGTQLGFVLALRPLVGILGQPFWGQVSDRTGARGIVLAFLAAASGITYLLVPFASGYPMLLALVATAAFFGTAVIPMASAVSMAALGPGATQHFGAVRVWGTLGFLVLVLGVPFCVEQLQSGLGWEESGTGPSEPGLGVIFFFTAAFSLIAAVVALALPRGGRLGLRARRGDTKRLLRHGPYRRIILVALLAFFLLQGPIQLFPLFIEARGGSLATVSRMWIPMLLVEIPLVFLSGATVARIGARGLVCLGLLADGLRWTACAFTDDLRIIFALQLLHGVNVAGVIVGIQLYVESVVPERLRSSGQGLVTMMGVSLGGVLSNLVAGWLFEHRGIDAPYLLGGLGAIGLGLASFWLLRSAHRPAAD